MLPLLNRECFVERFAQIKDDFLSLTDNSSRKVGNQEHYTAVYSYL